MNITSIEQLENIIKRQLAEAMEGEVFEVVRDTQREMVNEMVYDYYDPKDYLRRGVVGGLSAVSNITHDGVMIDDNTLEMQVKNTTRTNGDDMGYLTPLIVLGDMEHESRYGWGYDWTPPNDRRATYLLPRNFIGGTVVRLEMNRALENAFKRELERKGIDVK